MTGGHDACRLCAIGDGDVEVFGGLLYQDDCWAVRHSAPPHGVAGWLTLQTRRHVSEPAEFDDREARTYGQMLRYLGAKLRHVTGAPKVYTASFGEKTPHFHAHLVPRYPELPGGAAGVAVFDLTRRAKAGDFEVDGAEVDRIVAELRRAISSAPPATA